MRYTWYSHASQDITPDTVHQILVFGTLNDIKVLREQVGEKSLKEIFLSYPKKIYTASALYFIKKFILHISFTFDDKKYLKFTPRYTR